jgi:hypothetical protein
MLKEHKKSIKGGRDDSIQAHDLLFDLLFDLPADGGGLL